MGTKENLPLGFYCLRVWLSIYQADTDKIFGISRNLKAVGVGRSSEPPCRCCGAHSSAAHTPLPKFVMCIAISSSWKPGNWFGFAHVIDLCVAVWAGGCFSSFSCNEILAWCEAWEAAVVWGCFGSPEQGTSLSTGCTPLISAGFVLLFSSPLGLPQSMGHCHASTCSAPAAHRDVSACSLFHFCHFIQNRCVYVFHTCTYPPAWPWQNCTIAAPLQPLVQNRPLKALAGD